MVRTENQVATIYHPESEERKANFELIQREAVALSKSSWIPKHLIGKTPEETVATCVGLAQMADKWNMSTQMVAGETYSVHGRIGFQGKLYAALANAHGELCGGLRAIYSGNGDNKAAVIFGSDHELSDSDKELLKRYVKNGDADAATDLELNGVRCVRLVVGNVKTDNAMWKNDPEQKLYYSGCTKWCRRFMAELVLGAISVEDIERQTFEDRGGSKVEQVTARLLAKRGVVQEPEPESEPEPPTTAMVVIAVRDAESLEELADIEAKAKLEPSVDMAAVGAAVKVRAAELSQ
jgi:hypothetical protein